MKIWIGAGAGLLICLIIGGTFIGVFYTLGRDIWGQAEDLWEGIFSLIAMIMITVVGLAILRINTLQEKWQVKLEDALKRERDEDNHKKGRIGRWSRKYGMFLLPFVTVLREGMEAVVFVGGVSLGQPASSFPLAVVCGALVGGLMSYFIYRGSAMVHLRYFLIASTCFMYIIAAGLMSKSVWYFENYQFNRLTGGDAAEAGSGPGSYSVNNVVWHVNCCNPEIKDATGGAWSILNAIFGWTNTATVGTVLSYVFYWLFVIAALIFMRYRERKEERRILELENIAVSEKTLENDSSSEHRDDPAVVIRDMADTKNDEIDCV